MEFDEICGCLWGLRCTLVGIIFFVIETDHLPTAPGYWEVHRPNLRTWRVLSSWCCNFGWLRRIWCSSKLSDQNIAYASLRPTPRVDEQSMHIDPIFLTRVSDQRSSNSPWKSSGPMLATGVPMGAGLSWEASCRRSPE